LVALALLADCGGNAFTSANGAGGTAQAGAGGSGTIAGSANGGTTSRAGNSSGGSGQAGTSSGGSPPIAGNGGVNSGGTSSGGTGAAGSAGSSAGAGGSVLDKCPPNPPASGACKTGLECTYGDDLRAECRNRYNCVSGKWQSQLDNCAPLEDCSEVDGGIRQVGTSCPTVGVDCTFANGTEGLIYCRCDAQLAGTMSTPIWDCEGPPPAPCPKVLPNEGQPCDGSSSGNMCVYGSCDFGAESIAGMQCQNGVWTRTAGGCATAGG
jgi:hypothetical protein